MLLSNSLDKTLFNLEITLFLILSLSLKLSNSLITLPSLILLDVINLSLTNLLIVV